jgi:hypothetical protein
VATTSFTLLVALCVVVPVVVTITGVEMSVPKVTPRRDVEVVGMVVVTLLVVTTS